MDGPRGGSMIFLRGSSASAPGKTRLRLTFVHAATLADEEVDFCHRRPSLVRLGVIDSSARQFFACGTLSRVPDGGSDA